MRLIVSGAALVAVASGEAREVLARQDKVLVKWIEKVYV